MLARMTYVPPPQQQPPQPPSVARYGTGVPVPPKPKSKTPAWLWVALGLFAVCCVLSAAVGLVNTLTDKPRTADNQAVEPPTAATESPPAPQPTATSEAPSPAGPATTFGPGMYEVGVEVRAGTYTCTPIGSLAGYWERTKDASGEFDAIIANGLIKSGTQAIITIKAKEFFKVDRSTCTIR